jgi:hypothetical protein
MLTILLIAVLFPGEFWTRERLRGQPESVRVHQPLMMKSLVVVLQMVAAYFAGQPPAKVALIAGAVLLITRRSSPKKCIGKSIGPCY